MDIMLHTASMCRLQVLKSQMYSGKSLSLFGSCHQKPVMNDTQMSCTLVEFFSVFIKASPYLIQGSILNS